VTLLDEVGLDVGQGRRCDAGILCDHIIAAPDLASPRSSKPGDWAQIGRGFYIYKGGKKRGVDESVYGLLAVHPNGGRARRDSPAPVLAM